MFLLLVFGVFAAAAVNVNQDLIDRLPEDMARIIEDDALHLYKFQHSPSAPVSNLTETNDYFPRLRYGRIDITTVIYAYMFDPNSNIEYTMPTDRYLSLYIIRERTEFRAVDVDFQMTDGNCDALAAYYYDGEDSQVLEGEEETPGFPLIQRDEDGINLMYQLNDMPQDLYGREVMLYIPAECTLRINHVIVVEGLIEGATEDTLQGTERTVTTE